MVDLPRHWPKYCLDIKQAMRHYGADPRADENWPKQTSGQHDALADARHNMAIMNHLERQYRTANDRANFAATMPTRRRSQHD
jgi:hypothetical protein